MESFREGAQTLGGILELGARAFYMAAEDGQALRLNGAQDFV